MKVAIMQPYLFPYIGYFQLIHAVDRFVIYEDVNFIKQGWINRNNILNNGAASLFTVPLSNLSSHTLIKDVEVDAHRYPHWRNKFMKTLAQAYAKAPNNADTMALVDEVLRPDATHISRLASRSLVAVKERLGMETVIIPSSTTYGNTHLSGQARVLDICAKEKATTYINAQGGKELYDPRKFREHGMDLAFIAPELTPYDQGGHVFTKGLSIIDALMFLPVDRVRAMLSGYALDRPGESV
ncbi:MAG: WbqC family protein [Flavobacteriales bacterium]|nr:WbqC family protein [Flavobacteriales bacterium]